MQPIHHFRHCPKCAAAVPGDINPLVCGACGFAYFFNPTVSAAAFVFDATGRILLLRRAKEPARGLFGIPGGFIDIGEGAEEALHREVREEVGGRRGRVRVAAPGSGDGRGTGVPVAADGISAAAVPGRLTGGVISDRR
ncbi:MAG: NUDIX domain-containing protein [Fimbriiglobus sp.]|nr:NUDIX domain-containing protein [Fimbriiglobus sp.]